jgi:UDP-GlcNAc:undecaprenyl-phosphate/decaprenyl-phosphate GlcNAc-1-phosphate transferase
MTATILNAQWFIAATLALLLGALIGFLIFNFPPAKIFMGDGGSLVIGFLLAILTARTTYYNPDVEGYALGGGWYGVFMPIIVLAVPLYDLITVTIIRLRQGRSPFVGDQQHFSHRLVQRGLTKRGAVIVIWAATAVTGIGGIALGSLQPWQAVLVGVQTMLVLLMFALLEHASRHAAAKHNAS